MNAVQKQKQDELPEQIELSLISIEKSKRPSILDRIIKAIEPSDLTLERWTQLEMKRSRISFKSDPWRNS